MTTVLDAVSVKLIIESDTMSNQHFKQLFMAENKQVTVLSSILEFDSVVIYYAEKEIYFVNMLLQNMTSSYEYPSELMKSHFNTFFSH